MIQRRRRAEEERERATLPTTTVLRHPLVVPLPRLKGREIRRVRELVLRVAVRESVEEGHEGLVGVHRPSDHLIEVDGEAVQPSERHLPGDPFEGGAGPS